MSDMQSEQINELAKALAAAQKELAPATKNASNPMLKNRYADIAACIAACRDVLPKHGLAYSQMIAPAEAGNVCVDTLLMHESGQWIKSRCCLPVTIPTNRDGRSTINAAQAAGSAITYARRYGLSAIIGLATDDDDDGCGCERPQQRRPQEAPKPEPAKQKPASTNSPNPNLTPQQWGALRARISDMQKEFGWDNEQAKIEVCAIIGCAPKSTKDITAEEFHRFMEASEPKLPADPVYDNPF